ncbi:MAG: leucine-rich repeat protein [Lachnospiraceae bacterium]|nr:leucine-rich repeat protein [Lachnospiraceae bacterium]
MKADAKDVHTTNDGIEIECDYYEKIATVVGYEGEPNIVSIPAEYDGCTVDRIDDKAFAYSSTIQVVNIPNTIKYIGQEAFEYSKKLKEVNFAEDCDIEVLSGYAFNGCESLSKVVYPTKGFVIISDGAFSGCSMLKDCYISDRTEEIGNYAFENTGVTNLKITNSVKLIGSSAFRECQNITSVSIPASVLYIGNNVFMDCVNLVDATIKCNLISSGLFSGCINLKCIDLGDDIEEIESNAFSKTAISKIVIPYSVKKVGYGVFYYCEQLTDVYVLGKNIKVDEIFSSNSNITLHGIVGSGTDGCAKKYGISFVPIDSGELTATVNDAKKVVLSWSGVEGAQKYTIYRSNKESGYYEAIDELSSDKDSYIDKTVERGKTYYYFVETQKKLDETLIATVQSNIVKIKIEEVAIKLSAESIKVNRTAKLYLWASEDVENVQYEIDNPKIVSVKWGKEWNGNKIAVYLFGEKKGSTKITFSNDYNSDKVEVYVTVSQGKIKLSKVNIGKWKKVSKKNASVVEYKIKWASVKNASGYEVIESCYDGALRRWSSTKQTTKKTSWSYMTSRLDTSKVKIKVRAYRYEGNKKVYGGWSKIETTKIKF